MKKELQKKINQAIKLIQSAGEIAKSHGQPLEICYSGGKDSDIILELAKMAGVEYRAIYKNTTIDPPGTIRHAIDMGVQMIRPKKTFAQLIAEHGMPSRKVRFCCSILKEYKVLDYAVLGIRREESSKRKERYKEPEICRVYKKNEKQRQYLPLIDWTIDDVATFIKERGIKCAPVYYDKDGNFHPEMRLGCMCCPLASHTHRIKEFQQYPNMVKLYTRNYRKWMDKRLNKKSSNIYQNEYDAFVARLFFETHNDFINATDGLFGKVDCKTFLKDYFKIKF